MKLHVVLLASALAALLGGCSDLFEDDDAPVATAQPNGCSAQGCPQAAQFCTARGYQAGTDRYDRCIVSVEQNLRKGTQ